MRARGSESGESEEWEGERMLLGLLEGLNLLCCCVELWTGRWTHSFTFAGHSGLLLRSRLQCIKHQVSRTL